MTQTIKWQPFSPKHIKYIKKAIKCKMSVAEGAIRSGKTIDHCIIAAIYLETCPDRIHLASGSTIANAKMNIGDCNGFGLEHLFRGRCRWGKYRDNEALYIQTQTGEKIVIFAGGGKADSFKKILGNSYGLWIATEINQHYDSDESETSFIKVAFGRQLAAVKPLVLWDLNPSSPNNKIYSEYIDKYKLDFVGGYNYQHFTIADNLSVSEQRRKEIESQYDKNSVWYRRDILGLRCLVEGLIYNNFADDPSKYEIELKDLPPLIKIEVGIDFGGNKSAQAFVCCGYTRMFRDWIVLESERITEPLDTEQLNSRFVKFGEKVYNKYGRPFYCNYDNAEPVLGRGLANACLKAGVRCSMGPAIKSPILQRIRLTATLMAQHRFWLVKGQTESVKNALINAIWDPKNTDTRLDNGTSDIDSLDALEYSAERNYGNLMQTGDSIIYKKE